MPVHPAAAVTSQIWLWSRFLAFARFGDAILNYIANIDRASDKTITIARFSQSMYSAFEVLFNVWLNSKEVKVSEERV